MLSLSLCPTSKPSAYYCSTNQAYVQRPSKSTHTATSLTHSQLSKCFRPITRTKIKTQDEAHPPPRLHDGALLQPRSRRRQVIQIRQRPQKVKGSRSVSLEYLRSVPYIIIGLTDDFFSCTELARRSASTVLMSRATASGFSVEFGMYMGLGMGVWLEECMSWAVLFR